MIPHRAMLAAALLAGGLAGCTIPGERGLTADYAATPASYLRPNFKVTHWPGGRTVTGPVIESIEPGYTAIAARLRAIVTPRGVRHEALITLYYRYYTWYDFTAARGRPGELTQVGREWRCKGTDCTRSETVAVHLPREAIADAKSGILLHLISESGTTADVWFPLSYATAFRNALVRAHKAPDAAFEPYDIKVRYEP